MTKAELKRMFPQSIYGKSAMIERQRLRLAGQLNRPIPRRPLTWQQINEILRRDKERRATKQAALPL